MTKILVVYITFKGPGPYVNIQWRKSMLTLYGPRNVFDSFFADNLIDFYWPMTGSTRKGNRLTTAMGAVNINQETGEKEYVLEIPGFGRENVKITYQNNILSASGEIKDSSDKILKSFNVKVDFADVDKSTLKAEVKNGILTVKGSKKTVNEEHIVAVE